MNQKPFNDYRPAVHEIPTARFVTYLMLGYLAACLAASGCTERKTIYSTNNVPIAQDSTVCDWHKHGPKHHHHSRFCCFLGEKAACGPGASKVTKDEADRAREGNPEVKVGGGYGG